MSAVIDKLHRSKRRVDKLETALSFLSCKMVVAEAVVGKGKRSLVGLESLLGMARADVKSYAEEAKGDVDIELFCAKKETKTMGKR